MNDYERIARVIRELDARQDEQPDLAELSACAGLSPSHFHRLFSKWAGITPKDFVQALTVERAKHLLRQSASVMGAALDAGLSGPGRLHDLCVSLEAASPGEIKSGGAGWGIDAGFAATPFGACLIAQAARGICHLSFLEPGGEPAAWAEMRTEWPNARYDRNDRLARELAGTIFEREGRRPAGRPLRAFVRGTNFQVRVWRALLRIPPGHMVSYGQLAGAVELPSASRAVGSAVGQNCISFLIPCHRVIRSTGVFGNYRWGAVRKRAMVAWESAAAAGAERVVAA